MIKNIKDLEEQLNKFMAPGCKAVVNPCPVKVGGDKDGKLAILFYLHQAPDKNSELFYYVV